MKIINTIAAVCSIFGLAFAVWWAYVTAVYNDKHKVIAFVLVIFVAGMSAFICFALYRSWHSPNPISDRESELSGQHARAIYIGPGGIPLSISRDRKIKVNLTFFACTAIQLIYVKVQVGRLPNLTTISEGEPHQITAGELFTKTLQHPDEHKLRELMTLNLETLDVQGIAKFSGNIEKEFSFRAVPFLPN
jgi:hypothetical protein